MSVAESIFRAIKIRKIDYVFCVPGESFLAVMDSFYGSEKPYLISTRHEEGAGIMAEAYAKASNKTGVCIVTRGPGLAHVSIALHTARQDSTPLIVFVGQVPTNVRYREAFQELDIVDLVRPITKWAVEINRADRVLEIVDKAFHIANSGRPGPVVIGLPEDIDRSGLVTNSLKRETIISEPSTSIEGADMAARIIKQALRPCIVAGEGILRGNLSEKLVHFAEYVEVPVFTAWRRFDAFPNNHRLYMGGLHLSSINDELSEPLKKADLVIALGTRLDEFTTMNYSYPTINQKLIHIDQSPEDTGGSCVGADLAILANVGEAIVRIENSLKILDFRKPKKARLSEVIIWRNNFISKTTPSIVGNNLRDGEIDLQGIFYDIIKILDEDASTTCDAGDFGSWLIKFYKWNKPNTFFGPTSGAMGYALPAAIGAKLARPKSPAVAFAGDGGFAMTMSEFETAVRLNLGNLVVLVFNNNNYGTIKRHQIKEFPGRQIGTNLSEIDFSKIAKALGGIGYSVRKNEEFSKAFEEALNSKCPAVIDIKFSANSVNAWGI